VSFAMSQGIRDTRLTPELVRDEFASLMEWGNISMVDPFPLSGAD